MNAADITALLTRSGKLNEEKCYEEVCTLLKDDLLKACRSAELYVERAIAYRESGYFTHAWLDCREAIRIKPNYGYAYFHKGLTCYYQRDFTAAIRCYKKAKYFKVKREFLAPYYYDAYHRRGDKWEQEYNFKEAKNDYRKARRYMPDEIVVREKIRKLGDVLIDEFEAMPFIGRFCESKIWKDKWWSRKAVAFFLWAMKEAPELITNYCAQQALMHDFAAFEKIEPQPLYPNPEKTVFKDMVAFIEKQEATYESALLIPPRKPTIIFGNPPGKYPFLKLTSERLSVRKKYNVVYSDDGDSILNNLTRYSPEILICHNHLATREEVQQLTWEVRKKVPSCFIILSTNDGAFFTEWYGSTYTFDLLVDVGGALPLMNYFSLLQPVLYDHVLLRERIRTIADAIGERLVSRF